MTPIDRIYLDYNATSPLAMKVKNFLVSGDVPFANPSSQHASGKRSLKEINDVTAYLYKYFSLNPKEYNLFYHSGATEGINTILASLGKAAFIYNNSDHPCVSEMADYLKGNGAKVTKLKLKNSSGFDWEGLEKALSQYGKEEIIPCVNITWVHNESGHKTDLTQLLELKKKYQFYVHIDAVQSIGKIENYQDLNHYADAYTYSGHKFGALKGIGFSLYKKNLKLNALLSGGGQQGGLRSGTLNVQGIISLKLALEELTETFNASKLLDLKKTIQKMIDENQNLFQLDLGESNLNTVYFVNKMKKSDSMLIHFDLNGVDVSAGSACSAGDLNPSVLLDELGHEDFNKNSIRISFGMPSLKSKDLILEKLESIIKKL